MKTITRVAGTAIAVGLALSTVAGCNSATKSTSSGSGGTKAGTIALLLPESKTTRYENFDKPYFEAAAKAACADCKVIYSNANQDAAMQKQQAEAALTQGAKVIVLDSVDTQSGAGIAQEAKSQGAKVIAYDRFVEGADYYVSFDNEKVGELQATTLIDQMKKAGKTSGDIVMINGSPTDSNAPVFKKGAHAVIDKSGYKVVAEYDTPDWSPDKAQAWMESQSNIAKSLVGVYVANDGMAGGVISALKGSGINPLPPVTGQDAELAGVQRLVTGDQSMTIYKAIKPQATDAAKAAVALLDNKKPDAKTTFQNVPATLLDPVAVTKDNIKDTVVKDGFYTIDQICTADYKSACDAAGLK